MLVFDQGKLMKDVDGWEVGTLMGEPLYKTIGKDDWVRPFMHDYYMHADQDDWNTYIECHRRR